MTQEEKVSEQSGFVTYPFSSNLAKVSIYIFVSCYAVFARQVRNQMSENWPDSRARESRVMYANNPNAEIAARLTDFFDADTRMFISVSKHQEIASSIGYHDSGKVEDHSRRLYVFEIEIPEISIIRQQGLFQQGKGIFSNSPFSS